MTAIFFAILSILGCQGFRPVFFYDVSAEYYFPVQIVSFCKTYFDDEQLADLDNKVREQLQTAEYYYSTVGFHVKFPVLGRAEVGSGFVGVEKCREWAGQTPHIITIFVTPVQYMTRFGNDLMFVRGMSAFPWDSAPYGVFWFDPTLDDPVILAHELGHYFSLIHYWDTLGWTRDEVDINEPNIMNYSECPNTSFTELQGRQMKECLEEFSGKTRFPYLLK